MKLPQKLWLVNAFSAALGIAAVSAVLFAAAVPRPCEAHGGYPLSLAAVSGGKSGAALRLVYVYLGEGQGMNIQPLFFDDEAALQRAYGDGKADLVVHAPPPELRDAGCGGPPGAGDTTRKEHFSGLFPGSWSMTFATHPAGFCGLTLFAHPRVTEDLRFSLLKANLTKLLSGIDGREFADYLRAGKDDPRTQAAAARDLLRAKGLL